MLGARRKAQTSNRIRLQRSAEGHPKSLDSYSWSPRPDLRFLYPEPGRGWAVLLVRVGAE